MKKVVIIGAGPAGITAAHRLLSSGENYDVTILEETNDIGGISKTVKHNGNRMDIGGHRFFSKDAEVTRWWNEIMPMQGAPSYDDIRLGRKSPVAQGGPDPEKEDRVMLTRRRVSRIYYRTKFFDYPISMKAQTIKSMGLVTTARAGFSYLGSVAKKRAENSLEDFYINRFGRVLYSMFFEGYTEKLWGRHPGEISADWGAQRVKGLSIIAVIKDMFSKLKPRSEEQKKQVETSLIEEFSYPKFGPGQLWETAAAEVESKGGRIIRNCKVVKLENAPDGSVKRVVCDFNGRAEEFDADYFVSSMPLCDLISGMSDVPSDIAEIAAGLPYRDFVTVGLLVNKLNLKNETEIKTLGSIVPDCWIYVQDTGVKLGRIQIFNNWSPYMVADPENTVWIGLEYFCNEGDAFWSMNDGECIAFAVDELVKMGVIDSGTQIFDSHREKIKKAYPAYFDTYKDIDKLTAYLNKYQNLYCVGRNGQHRYNNMDHSMLTSIYAVDSIIKGTDKTRIWKVNTEQEYHEEK